MKARFFSFPASLFLVFLAMLVLPLQEVTGSWELPLTIKEKAGLDWRNHPVTVGIPVPRGEKGLKNPPRLLDPWGREVPTQAVQAGTWPQEGTPRWWLLTFPASVNKNDSISYRLVAGDRLPSLPSNPLEIRETPEGVTVDTGNICLEIRADEPLFHRVWFDASGRRNYDENNLVLKPGMEEVGLRIGQEVFQAKSASPAAIILEEQGPVKAVIKIEGDLCCGEGNKEFTYTCRVEAYAGTPFLQIDLTLVNAGRGEWAEVEEAWIEFSLPGEGKQKWEATFGSGEDTPVNVVLEPEDEAWVAASSRAEIEWGGKVTSPLRQQERRATSLGWADLTGKALGAAVGIEGFWPQYPKRLCLSGEGKIRAELVPPGSPVKWARGTAKTHRLFLFFHAQSDREYSRIMEGILSGPPVGILPSFWYEESGVFSQPVLPALEEYPEEIMFLTARSQTDLLNLFGPPAHGLAVNPRHWGLFNYGDLMVDFSLPWAPQGTYWNNNYYDLPYLLLLEFVRTGEPVFLDLARPAVTHLGDVDLSHPWGTDRVTPGLEQVKSFYTGELAATEYFSHTKNRGLLLSYYLLGDYRGRELAVRVADWVCLHDGINPWEPRTFGLGIIAALTGYEATGEERYLLRAGEIVRSALDWESSHEGGFPADFIYQAGLAVEGLVEYYRRQKDPEILAGIKSAVEKAVFHFWDQDRGYLQNQGGLTFSSALALLYRETGEEIYRQIGLRQLRTFLDAAVDLTPKDAALSYRNIYALFSQGG